MLKIVKMPTRGILKTALSSLTYEVYDKTMFLPTIELITKRSAIFTKILKIGIKYYSTNTS